MGPDSKARGVLGAGARGVVHWRTRAHRVAKWPPKPCALLTRLLRVAVG